jgi:hypothetical protein
MPDIHAALVASKAATDELCATCDRTGPSWLQPRAPGKWSPSQIVEHVAMSLEESANVAMKHDTHMVDGTVQQPTHVCRRQILKSDEAVAI